MGTVWGHLCSKCIHIYLLFWWSCLVLRKWCKWRRSLSWSVVLRNVCRFWMLEEWNSLLGLFWLSFCHYSSVSDKEGEIPLNYVDPSRHHLSSIHLGCSCLKMLRLGLDKVSASKHLLQLYSDFCVLNTCISFKL